MNRPESSETPTPAKPEECFEVRVTLTVAIPYTGKYPGLMDAFERVGAALRQEKPLPEGAYVRGGVDVRVRTEKEMRADAKRADAKRRREA